MKKKQIESIIFWYVVLVIVFTGALIWMIYYINYSENKYISSQHIPSMERIDEEIRLYPFKIDCENKGGNYVSPEDLGISEVYLVEGKYLLTSAECSIKGKITYSFE